VYCTVGSIVHLNKEIIINIFILFFIYSLLFIIVSNLLKKIYTISLFTDTPNAIDSSVDVLGDDEDDDNKSNYHKQALENVGDQNRFDATQRGVGSTYYSEY